MYLRLTREEGGWLRKKLEGCRSYAARRLTMADTDAEQIRQHADMDLAIELMWTIDDGMRRTQ